MSPTDHVAWSARRARSFGVAMLLALASSVGPTASADSVPAGPRPPAAPTQAELTDAVHRLVSPTSDADACHATGMVRGEQRYECTHTECGGACRVTRITTVLGVRSGRWRRVSRHRADVGDTGECGDCM